MPLYEYHCPANGKTVEVKHSMSQTLKTWGELCQAAGIEAGETPAKSEIQRAITAGYVATSGSAPATTSHRCGTGGCGCH